MKLWKLTNADDQTQNNTQWGENVTHTASGEGELCSKGWLHAYTDPFLAVLLNPIHADFDPKTMHLWECEGEVGATDHGLKVGCTTLTTIKRIPIPDVTTEQLVKFAILCALKTADCWEASQAWRDWAAKWLDGTDRSEAAAWAAWAAADAAARAAWAADEAARAAARAAWAAWAAEAEAKAAWAATWAAWAADIDLIVIAREAVSS